MRWICIAPLLLAILAPVHVDAAELEGPVLGLALVDSPTWEDLLETVQWTTPEDPTFSIHVFAGELADGLASCEFYLSQLGNSAEFTGAEAPEGAVVTVEPYFAPQQLTRVSITFAPGCVQAVDQSNIVILNFRQDEPIWETIQLAEIGWDGNGLDPNPYSNCSGEQLGFELCEFSQVVVNSPHGIPTEKRSLSFIKAQY